MGERNRNNERVTKGQVEEGVDGRGSSDDSKKTMQITIYGQCPAQKNSKSVGVNPHTGRTFVASNKTVKNWQKSALLQLMPIKEKVRGRVQIDYMFYVKDNVQRDIDNMIATINDTLQAANADQALQRGKMKAVKGTGIIQGDNWQLLEIGSAKAAIDKENPRAEITITEL